MTALERLRALRNSETTPTMALTKLTKTPYVSFVSDQVPPISEIHAPKTQAPEPDPAWCAAWLATVADHLGTTPDTLVRDGIITAEEVASYTPADPAAFAMALRHVHPGRFAAPDSDDDRRHCRTCSSLTESGRCMEAYRGALPAARETRSIDTIPRRCGAYVPRLDDPDQRPGAERWPWMNEQTDVRNK